jgi:hypothetical protein
LACESGKTRKFVHGVFLLVSYLSAFPDLAFLKNNVDSSILLGVQCVSEVGNKEINPL